MATRRHPGHPGSVKFESVRKSRTPSGGTLASLRRSLGVSQEEMAGRLGVGQAAISKIENRDDPQLNSLVRYCDALGGQLELVVTFPAKHKPKATLTNTLRVVSSDPPLMSDGCDDNTPSNFQSSRSQRQRCL